jgi:hypothetical protein
MQVCDALAAVQHTFAIYGVTRGPIKDWLPSIDHL